MVNKKYYKPDISKEWIRKSPFRYSFNDVYEIAYTYRFPVYKNGSFVTLECELTVFDKTGDVRINVYEYGTRDKYAAFYCDNYGKNIVLESVHKKINKELNKLGIIQKER